MSSARLPSSVPPPRARSGGDMAKSLSEVSPGVALLSSSTRKGERALPLFGPAWLTGGPPARHRPGPGASFPPAKEGSALTGGPATMQVGGQGANGGRGARRACPPATRAGGAGALVPLQQSRRGE